MRRAAAAVALLALAGCGGDDGDPGPAPPAGLTLESPAFRDGGALPGRFACDGAGKSPPLRWSGVPDDAQDLALVVDDRDVPVGAFTHWTAWRLPFEPDGSGRVLEGNVPPEMAQGQNDAGSRGWAPVCPPDGDGAHTYVFTLYALDRPAELHPGASPAQVRAALTASALAQGRLEATYDR
jgi:Raf kinase inhibitor-like YbhB/YbcL family protein